MFSGVEYTKTKTNSYLFLLGGANRADASIIDEQYSYSSYFSSSYLPVASTDYSTAHHTFRSSSIIQYAQKTLTSNLSCYYWLRSGSKTTRNAATRIDVGGNFNEGFLRYTYQGVRPALVLNI